MKKIRLNTLHRYVGIVIAPFMVIQTLSGVLLAFGLFRGGSTGEKIGRYLVSRGIWDQALVNAHFGPGMLDDTYHLILGAGIIWMAVSGWVLYLRGRRARRKQPTAGAVGERPSGAGRP
jgi:uncharacterized iron-regulated membrane protein